MREKLLKELFAENGFLNESLCCEFQTGEIFLNVKVQEIAHYKKAYCANDQKLKTLKANS